MNILFKATILSLFTLLAPAVPCNAAGKASARAAACAASTHRQGKGGLPDGAKLIARFSDKRRNTVYYLYNERIYCHDRSRHMTSEVAFPYGYVKIVNIYTSPLRSRIFVVLDMGDTANRLLDGQQLWVINSFNRKCTKVGEGFHVTKGKDCIIVSKGYYCKNSNAPLINRVWRARDHYYDFTGKVLWIKNEYDVKEQNH